MITSRLLTSYRNCGQQNSCSYYTICTWSRCISRRCNDWNRKDRYNTVHLQIVGNEYMYGQNYIYEPIYYNTPLIYNSFGPIITDRMYQTGIGIIIHHTIMPGILSVYRYRNNIQVSLNINNNYVNYRKQSSSSPLQLETFKWVWKTTSNNNFSRRNTNVSNRYELEQRRSRNEINYSQNRSQSSRWIHRERAKEIFLKIETNRHEKSFSKEIKETTLKK
jgi:hypothetical protein